MHQTRVLCTLDSQTATRFARGLCMALGFMKTRTQNGWLVAWALFGGPLLYASTVHFSYNWALANDRLPFTSSAGAYVAYAILGVWLVSGLFSLWLVSFRRMWYRVAACAAYTVAVSVSFLGITLYVACSHGDCL
jgi:hypothetical protein